MAYEFKYPKCIHQHSDCFANVEGFCKVLTDTSFGLRDCPFYKSREQCDTELQQIRERLARKEVSRYTQRQTV